MEQNFRHASYFLVRNPVYNVMLAEDEVDIDE